MAARSGVQERVFFDIFSSEQECLQAALDVGLQRLSQAVDEAVGCEGSWLDRLRAGLVAFLGFLDDEPAWGRLLIVDWPVTGGMIGSRGEQQVLGVLTSLLDHRVPGAARELMLEPMLTSEFVVGGAISVIRAKMLNGDGAALVGLAPSLMSFMVRPYLGEVAANTEFQGRPSANDNPSANANGTSARPAVAREAALARTASLPIRVTHRTTMVLRAIARAPYANNREVAQAAGLVDEGQTSKLLARLEHKGVIENVGVGAARGEPNAWLLTPSGRRAIELIDEGLAAGARRPRSAGIRGAA